MLKSLLSLFKGSDKHSYVCTDIRRIEYGNQRHPSKMWVATVAKVDANGIFSNDFQIFNTWDDPVGWAVAWRYENGKTCYSVMTSGEFESLDKAVEKKFSSVEEYALQTDAARTIAEVKLAMKKD